MKLSINPAASEDKVMKIIAAYAIKCLHDPQNLFLKTATACFTDVMVDLLFYFIRLLWISLSSFDMICK